jgi:hypothetical protein
MGGILESSEVYIAGDKRRKPGWSRNSTIGARRVPIEIVVAESATSGFDS